MFLLLIRMSPFEGASWPAISLRVVVFPQPEGPNKQTNSPSGKISDRLSTAIEFPPKFLIIDLSFISDIYPPKPEARFVFVTLFKIKTEIITTTPMINIVAFASCV